MTASKILLYFCLSFVLGIFLNSFLKIPQFLMLSFLIFGVLLISVFWRCKKFIVVGFCILFLVFGIWRHQNAELRIVDDELRILNDQNEIVTLEGIVTEEPALKEKSQKLTIKIERIETEDGSPMVEGRILATTRKYPQYQYGDKVKITGKLEAPSEDLQGFNYKDYLKKDGIYSIINFPKIELLGFGFGNPTMKFIFSLKNKFKEAVGNFISPPQLGILEALVFGDEENISKGWKDKLNHTGTRHITAVSGMNITIISSLILAFLLSFGLWRNQAFFISIILIAFYILMIGAPASALRAGIMAGILMLAQYFGRPSMACRVVVFAAAVMLFQNPLLLKLDVGFQLSFLAILGLIELQPIFFNWLRKIPNPKIFLVRTTLSATLAAQVFTLPILIYNFGYIPLVSPVTNILIVPFLAPITILIFIFGLSAILFWPLGELLSWLTWLSLTYIVILIDWFSRFPFASLAFDNLHWAWLIISYLILGFVTWRLQERQKLKFLNY